MYKKKGFTLIELTITVVIIGVLSAIAIPKLFDYTEKARLANDLQALSAVHSAFDVALLDDRVLSMLDTNSAFLAKGFSIFSLSFFSSNAEGWAKDKTYEDIQKSLYFITKDYLGDKFYKNLKSKWKSEILQAYSLNEMGIRVFVSHPAGDQVCVFSSLRTNKDDSQSSSPNYYVYRDKIIGAGTYPTDPAWQNMELNGRNYNVKWKKVELVKH